MWKGEVGALVLVDYLQTLFGGFTRGLSNLCDTAFLITSSSVFGVKYIGLTVLVSPFFHMEEKSELELEHLEIDPTILKIQETC